MTPGEYDAQGRITMSDTTALEANGIVDFPYGNGHGERVEFQLGERVGSPVTY
jgi:hypothetical protein